MTSSTARLAIGDRVWLDGSVVRVIEMSASRAVIETEGGTRAVSTAYLASTCQLLDSAPRSTVPSNQFLTNLTEKQATTFRERMRVVEAVLELHHTSGESISQSCETVATTNGISDRTIKRWLSAYGSSGPAGLLDPRKQRPTINPEWRQACLDVLGRY